MRKVKKLLGFILIGGAVICLTMAAVEYMKYDEAIQEYDDIEEKYTTTEDYPETPDIADESFSIDWASLKQQNADLVGWIRMDTGASYPIVQGTDNSYYLKHSFNNTYSINGAIFMNSHNSSSWEDYNTVVYGHNMNNGSMFGSNKKYKEAAYLKEHPYFYVYIPGGYYKYRIFSTATVRESSEAYQTVFTGPADFNNYLDAMLKLSSYSAGVKPASNQHVVTLSTCTGKEDKRFIIQGYLENEVITNEKIQEQ